VRIVLDTFCNTPIDALVVNRNARTIICCKEEPENKIFPDNVELLFCKIDRNGYLNLDDVLRKLYQKNIQSLLVEGGGTVIWNFLLNRFVDDLYVYIGPMIIGGKQTPTMADGDGIINAEDAISLSILDILQLDHGLLIHYQLKKN
jgi:2,5-diamino-6-(ribosylamino)-4(3H)-pyrimidinone 5'-phosphate reductase